MRCHIFGGGTSQNIMNKDCTKYAPAIVRLGLAFVFLWFGLSQLFGPSSWIGLIPSWLVSLTGISATTFVILNGLFEVIAGTLLVFGIWTRIVAGLLFLHLITIIFDVGLSAIGIRDIGLALATLSVSLYGQDDFSLKCI